MSPDGDQYADTTDKSAAGIVVGAVYYTTFAHCGFKVETEAIVFLLLDEGTAESALSRNCCNQARSATNSMPAKSDKGSPAESLAARRKIGLRSPILHGPERRRQERVDSDAGQMHENRPCTYQQNVKRSQATS